MRPFSLAVLLALTGCSVDTPDADQDFFFKCGSDDDCRDGYHCINRLCVAGEQPKSCGRNMDCYDAPYTYCEDGRCIDPCFFFCNDEQCEHRPGTYEGYACWQCSRHEDCTQTPNTRCGDGACYDPCSAGMCGPDQTCVHEPGTDPGYRCEGGGSGDACGGCSDGYVCARRRDNNYDCIPNCDECWDDTVFCLDVQGDGPDGVVFACLPCNCGGAECSRRPSTSWFEDGVDCRGPCPSQPCDGGMTCVATHDSSEGRCERACDGADNCPTGFTCVPVRDAWGGEVRACVACNESCASYESCFAFHSGSGSEVMFESVHAECIPGVNCNNHQECGVTSMRCLSLSPIFSEMLNLWSACFPGCGSDGDCAPYSDNPESGVCVDVRMQQDGVHEGICTSCGDGEGSSCGSDYQCVRKDWSDYYDEVRVVCEPVAGGCDPMTCSELRGFSCATGSCECDSALCEARGNTCTAVGLCACEEWMCSQWPGYRCGLPWEGCYDRCYGGDCPGGYVCENERCVSHDCDSSGGCGQGQRCEAFSGACICVPDDCYMGGYRCLGNTCTNDCGSPSDCEPGYDCQGGAAGSVCVCTPETCESLGGDFRCTWDGRCTDRCWNDQDCGRGLWCDWSTSNGDGGRCQCDESQCRNEGLGFRCTGDGRCTNDCSDGTDCGAGLRCNYDLSVCESDQCPTCPADSLCQSDGSCGCDPAWCDDMAGNRCHDGACDDLCSDGWSCQMGFTCQSDPVGDLRCQCDEGSCLGYGPGFRCTWDGRCDETCTGPADGSCGPGDICQDVDADGQWRCSCEPTLCEGAGTGFRCTGDGHCTNDCSDGSSCPAGTSCDGSFCIP